MTDKSDPLDEIDGSGLELTSSERMQRMRKLMRELYQEEEATRIAPLPVARTKNLLLAVSVGAVLILLATTFYNFNRFIAAEEMVLSARGSIQAALQRRSNLFGNLVNLTLNHAMLEQEVFRYVSDGRIDMTGRASGKQASMLPSLGDFSASAFSRLFALVEQYPDIKTSTTYQQLMDKLMDIENLISTRRGEYNDHVRSYNTTISSFPWSVMAKILGFRRYQYFTAEAEPENANMDLSSSKFNRLIPEKEFDTFGHHQGNRQHPNNNSGNGANRPDASQSGVEKENGYIDKTSDPVKTQGSTVGPAAVKNEKQPVPSVQESVPAIPVEPTKTKDHSSQKRDDSADTPQAVSAHAGPVNPPASTSVASQTEANRQSPELATSVRQSIEQQEATAKYAETENRNPEPQAVTEVHSVVGGQSVEVNKP